MGSKKNEERLQEGSSAEKPFIEAELTRDGTTAIFPIRWENQLGGGRWLHWVSLEMLFSLKRWDAVPCMVLGRVELKW